MEIQYQVATLNHIDLAFSFSETRFDLTLSEMERMMAMWKVRWRKEAIAHYFQTGWSFVAYDGAELAGYFMAQPIVHFRGQTQSVWVEHLEGTCEEVIRGLIEVAIKVAREKHMQRVLFSSDLAGYLAQWNAAPAEENFLEVKTTKG